MPDTKVVVNCEAYGAPSPEVLAKIREQAMKALEKGDTEKAAGIMAEHGRLFEIAATPAVQEIELTKEEIEQRKREEGVAKEQRVRAAREQRNALLAGSDWTQLPDSPVKDSKAWTKYRQTLRDMDFSDPDKISWPKAPK